MQIQKTDNTTFGLRIKCKNNVLKNSNAEESTILQVKSLIKDFNAKYKDKEGSDISLKDIFQVRYSKNNNTLDDTLYLKGRKNIQYSIKPKENGQGDAIFKLTVENLEEFANRVMGK
ncbi:MAG: hypothetical protein WCY19_08805 [Candidatus Gastranaerophilaceae bacterium]